MPSFITLLAYVEQVYVIIESHILVWKSWLRQKLGPEPATEYWMFENGEVIPATPTLKRTPKWIYTTATQSIHDPSDESPTRKRLPWLSLMYRHGDDIHDFSEWMSGIRGPPNIPLISLLRLGGAVFGIPVFVDDSTVVTVVERATGEEITYHIQSSVELVVKNE
jgi:hypothetical protein